ncbi:hypothetical protein DE146DRAFT_442950 [Phaeosphaeria sp. MPI-PUGE-AT-0046c]|nr:hypothetical protein DE146DRAFT_442950 [Phaeosphaeria sp. MPI-PUGE-AT-0046c]
MGNNQSTVGHHNRLSKPKTNTNSPAPPSAIESPVSLKSRYTDLSAKGRYHVQETSLSPLETENGWPSKDEDAVGELAPHPRGRPLSIISRSNSRANSRTNSRTNSRSNSLSCFGSRQGSTTKLTDLHGSKTSLNGQVDLEAAIRLLQEVKKNGSPEDLAALHEALDSSAHSALPTLNGPVLSRRTSSANGSCSSLTRRRSLVQTPGLATRNSPVEGRRRTWNSWRAPQIAPEEEAKWAVKSKAPPNRQSMHGAMATTPRYYSPRAQTPSEMDYSHLGSLQLGTLSIVNGAPSPAASARMVLHKSQPRGEVDYFTAAEAGTSPLAMKTKRRGHAKSKSSVLPATAPLYNLDTQKTAQPARPKTQHSKPRRDNQDSTYTFQQTGESAKTFRITNGSTDCDDHDAKKYAQDYQAYIPYSPFALKFPQAEENESRLLGDETSFRDEAAQILAGATFDAPTTATESSGSVLFPSTVPRVGVSGDQPKKSNIRPSPRTSDSGYSSGGSLTERGRRSADSSRKCGKEERTALHIPDRLERPSTSESLLSPISPCSVASKSSTDSIRSTTQRRLQRRRPSQPELPVIQSCQSIPEGTIPDVPDNVRAKFTRRLSHTPDMECLTQTFPSKDHVLTRETAADPPEAAPAEIFTQLTELEPERPPPQPAHERHRSLSLFRRKSTVENKEVDTEDTDAPLGVVDLGTIASSLGSSPYDAAMTGQRRKSVTSPTHPHQLGSTLPRAKSMVSMDSEAAVEFARMRSKDRALMEQHMPRQRRRSFHNLKIEAGEAKASKRRPQYSPHDIPPVPAMPAIDPSMLKAPLSATPRLGRETEQKAQGASFSARCQTKSEVVPQLVYKYDQQEQKVPAQTLEWDEHARHWSHRRKSVGEGLRTRASFNEASASTINSRNNTQPRVDMAAWGRYSGGLEYNYEGRDHGVGGSAGTRSHHSAASSKSMQWRNQYGVDFSDVPVFLQRA